MNFEIGTIDIIIVNYNTRNLADLCISNLLKLDLKLEIIFIDNNSSDGSYQYIKGKYGGKIICVQNERNVGYSAAANKGIRISKSKYVIVLNTDVLLTKKFIIKTVTYLEENTHVGAVSGKLIKYDFNKMESLNVIDSTGIVVYKNMKMEDRGQNETDLNKYDNNIEVFGVSGAAPVFRKKALEDTKISGEYYDEDFFAYKEDIDLSWRLRAFGWECHFVPEAVAYHGRAISRSISILNMKRHREKQSEFIRRLSFINSYLILIKNMDSRNIIRIIPRELLKLTYVIIFEPRLLKTIPTIIKLGKKMLQKRRSIRRKIKNKSSKVFFE
ncbi:GT2 family glycosyltransferase [Caldalkalibacillus uzonensis]|uniref:GT2 family glycosyltransferase n=1 Tax=Caldalkalibacillus uzonensis TaxID=353224 RepID=A0ABU0CTN3_9BACI|nr:glycosyltransferase family 2 protein [Caldalkalibacillus uzonensis]MDQ0339462.1 GT2 family glycosyltransferase [Caldalkalibacillus uzonensis]